MTALTLPHRQPYPADVVTLLATGLGSLNDHTAHKRHRRPVGAFFASAASCYGGGARDTFGCAGFRVSQSANARTVTTLTRLAAGRGDSNTHGVSTMSNHAQGASAPSLLSRSIAAAHRRMALAALRADSSATVRLARYNAHMTKARHLEGRSHV